MAKILHLGNIANNAYNNAKYLNHSGAHEHRALSYDNPHVMASPEWEEIDSFDAINEFSPDWSLFNYEQPEWFTYIETSSLNAEGRQRYCARLYTFIAIRRRRLAYWLKDQGLKKTGLKLTLPITHNEKVKTLLALPIYAILHILHWLNGQVEQLLFNAEPDPSGYKLTAKKLLPFTYDIDLIEGYGPDIIIPYLLKKPYIAYEHGTIRNLPFDGTPRAELLSLAYKQAKHVIITNPDVIFSVEKLGLKNITYIPHAVDCERFIPGQNRLLRKKYNLTDEIVILAPARQNWDIKCNDRYINAFAKVVQEIPHSKLFICDWGQHRDLTKNLVVKLGISAKVEFYRPCPKLTSVHFYQMADIVIDQFLTGAFGGITPEAMACGKPTLVHYKPELHEWCFKSDPPVVNTSDSESIASALLSLAKDKSWRKKLGQLGREWVLNEYSIKQLVERHNILYKKILG